MTTRLAALVALIVGLLVGAMGGLIGGNFYGQRQGVIAESARRDGKLVQDMTTLLEQHSKLVKRSNAASRAMRAAADKTAAVSAQTSKELTDALTRTADSRAGCVFPADVMRQLDAAAARATQATAHGSRAALPAAAASAQRPRGGPGG